MIMNLNKRYNNNITIFTMKFAGTKYPYMGCSTFGDRKNSAHPFFLKAYGDEEIRHIFLSHCSSDL